ncbi:MAG TPA: response regulator transcription factor [Candidatus Nanopelagicales bacterium]
MTISVGICDDQALIRDGLRAQLGMVPDIEVVGVAADGLQAVALARTHRPAVLLMDIRMPGLDGIEATRRICADPQCAGVRTVILTTFDVDELVYAALAAGASGFLVKDATPEDIVRAIRVVAAGEALLAPTVTSRLIHEFARRAPAPHRGERLATLTQREREILVLVARGMSNAEIADALTLSPATVKTHVSRILAKADARDRAQLVVLAYESGLVSPAP